MLARIRRVEGRGTFRGREERPGVTDDGRLDVRPEAVTILAAMGVVTVADVLARAEVVRDLPDRTNLVLRTPGACVHVKRSRRRGPSREAVALETAARAGVPVARIAFTGRARGLGSVVGTFDLAPARPLDDLLREGRLDADGATAALRATVRAAAALHAARLHHHDLYLNHVFVDPADPTRATLIDLERTTSHHGLLGRAVVKDLAAIHATIPDAAASCAARVRLLACYLEARRFPIWSLLGPLTRRVVAKAARIRAHVPRTPVGAAAAGRPGAPAPGATPRRSSGARKRLHVRRIGR